MLFNAITGMERNLGFLFVFLVYLKEKVDHCRKRNGLDARQTYENVPGILVLQVRPA